MHLECGIKHYVGLMTCVPSSKPSDSQVLNWLIELEVYRELEEQILTSMADTPIAEVSSPELNYGLGYFTAVLEDECEFVSVDREMIVATVKLLEALKEGKHLVLEDQD